MLAAIKSFFGGLWGGSPDDSLGGGHLSDGGLDRFSAEYGGGWDARGFGWGASGETSAAEADYERRLQNTMDAHAVRNALQRGDTQAVELILRRNAEVGIAVGNVELYGAQGVAALRAGLHQQLAEHQQATAPRLAGQAQPSAGAAGGSDGASAITNLTVDVPVTGQETQWDVVARGLQMAAAAAGLPEEEQQRFAAEWLARLQRSGETGIYTYAGNDQQRVGAGTFGADKRDGMVRFTIDARNHPEMMADLQRRVADIDSEVVRVETSIQGEPSRSAEGIGSFLTGALAGGFSNNDSWSAVGGQTIIGLVPVVGQIADARDIIAAGRDVYQGKEGGWAGLGIAAVAVIPGLDFLKGGSRVGRKLLAETAERGLSEVSQEGVEELGKTLSREAAERASREAVVLSVAREEMLARLDILAKDASLSQSTRDALSRAQNALRKHLNQEDLIGALRDNNGMPVIKHGKQWDHLTEVDNALTSLRNARARLLNDLDRLPLGTPEYRQLSQEIEAIAETVRRMDGYTKIK